VMSCGNNVHDLMGRLVGGINGFVVAWASVYEALR
jgi:hypothetical protein